jgi:hypothetical protein
MQDSSQKAAGRKKRTEDRRQRTEDRGKIVDLRLQVGDLSFGLPPFGRVPSFGLRIADFEFKKTGRR